MAKANVMGALQKLSKALMGAVAVLPVAALLCGIGYWIQAFNENSILATIFLKSGGAVMDNLGIVFALALAFGLAKDHNGAAALSGFVGFQTVILLIGPESVASYRGIEDPKELTGDAALHWASQGWDAINAKNVLIGIVVGILAAATYNKFSRTRLPDFLAFFSGRRLVPILTAVFSMLIAGILYILWPLLYNVLFNFGEWIQGMGVLGAGIYGVVNRLLIPTGLHHALNSIFWFDVIGINDIGKFMDGAKTIEAARQATDAASCPGVWNGTSCEVIGEVGRYQAGFFPAMMFGIPGAALAMYLRADKQRRKVVGSLMAAGALASFFTGVTEPLEFSFMFAAPLLYVVHALLTGLALSIAAAFHWTSGFGFSAGMVDMTLSSQNPLAHQWWMLLLMGVVYFFLYLGIFWFLIGKLNLKTPGRGDAEQENSAVLTDIPDEANGAQEGSTSTAANSTTSRIIQGLGGADNIETLDHCATRLRVTVKDDSKVEESILKSADVAGLIRPSAHAVQVIIGPQVQFVHDDVAAELANLRCNQVH
ncbi:N-acetylglucosamine-specific PTS transporter subunit IIBC [Corynebacterium poyangense]|nr:N-acetylglucosamine-specific PTS transporter subunit IIBC [Corynebacterium poyangense]